MRVADIRRVHRKRQAKLRNVTQGFKTRANDTVQQVATVQSNTWHQYSTIQVTSSTRQDNTCNNTYRTICDNSAVQLW